MKHFNQSRRDHLCAAAGVTPTLAFDALLAHYSEPHRAYHNARHIDERLADIDSDNNEPLTSIAVEFAILFHDVIYDPRATDNEKQSAALAHRCLQNVNNSLATSVSQLIITTKTHQPSSTPDAPLLLD